MTQYRYQSFKVSRYRLTTGWSIFNIIPFYFLYSDFNYFSLNTIGNFSLNKRDLQRKCQVSRTSIGSSGIVWGQRHFGIAAALARTTTAAKSAWHVAHGAWRVARGAWRMARDAHGAWCVTRGAWRVTPRGAWCVVRDTWRVARGAAWCVVRGA